MTKKVINLAEYKELSWDLQLNILHQDGVHVGKRVIQGQRIILFQLYGFYVEVYYSDYRKEVSHIITSASADILQPYLDQIHIRDLDQDNTDNNSV
jgi:hypothetical protein